MDNIAREVLKTKLKSLKGTAFHDTIDRIFLIIHGENEFHRIKQKRDKGLDGILTNNLLLESGSGSTSLAIYAPESYTLKGFKNKIGSDFKSYNDNLSVTYPNWAIVTNLEATTEMVMFVNSLKDGAPILCIEKILELINKQTWTKKSQIFNALEIPDRYLSNNVLSAVVEDLISICDNDRIISHPYEKPTYIETKINLNVSKDNIDTFLNEYADCLGLFPTLSYIIQSNKSNNIAAIRSKISSTYIELSGIFEERLKLMVNHLSGDRVTDDYYTCRMRVVLIYFFEQCLFGVKTEEEKCQ